MEIFHLNLLPTKSTRVSILSGWDLPCPRPRLDDTDLIHDDDEFCVDEKHCSLIFTPNQVDNDVSVSKINTINVKVSKRRKQFE